MHQILPRVTPFRLWLMCVLALSLMWGCSETESKCTVPTCFAGETRCESNSVMVCEAGGECEEGKWVLQQLCASNEVCGKPSGAETYQCLLSPWNSDGPVPGDAGVGDDDVESPEKPLEDTTTEEDSDVLSDVIEDVVAQDAATSSDAGIDSDSGSEEEELDGEGDALPADESDAVSDVEETDEEDGKVEEEADVDSVEDDVVVPDGDSADAEEVGACEDEKQGGTFDEDSLQAKLLTAGIACQDPEEFGSIEHVNCLRAQFMETGIGPDCADCFSNFVLCFFAECGEACADVDTNPEPCVECKDTTTCDESLNECAGLNW